MDCIIHVFIFCLMGNRPDASYAVMVFCIFEEGMQWANVAKPHQLSTMDPESIKSAPWVAGAPIKILIHGYTGHKDSSPNTEIRPAYMNCCDYNVISVDYNPLAREPCYVEGARNTELVGKCTAQLIDQLVTEHSFDLQKFHVIGFSLGGQTAGFIGNYLTSGQLNRLTALDPAKPLFITEDKTKKVDSGDAKYVECLHTNGLLLGKLETCGLSDWYPNGGLTQPGCVTTKDQTTPPGCDHARAPAYYAESITTDVGFYGTKCSLWFTATVGWCKPESSDDKTLYGEWMSLNTSGLYHFDTNSESPYARGRK